ncbi:MAG: DUF1122 family protein [Caldisphaera sp.]|uniref:DUF1122 family protein n=1 Tax=Caldisphaera sp. TaxID=2060322 RepID=UPI003D13619B
MKKDFINKLKEGFKIEDYEIRSGKISNGRFKEEKNLLLIFKYNKEEISLLKMKIFLGRPPYYKPWVEVFDIPNKIKVEGLYIDFYDSKMESKILEFLSENLEPGDKLFVEYTNDEKTLKELSLGIIPVLTRLGFKLFNLGFFWLKDWYYPEGFMEGGPKIQAEKVDSSTEINKQLNSIYNEIVSFKYKQINKELQYRIELILKYIEKNLH